MDLESIEVVLSRVWRLTRDPRQLQLELERLGGGSPAPYPEVGVVVGDEVWNPVVDAAERVVLRIHPRPRPEPITLEWVRARDGDLEWLYARTAAARVLVKRWESGCSDVDEIVRAHGYVPVSDAWSPASACVDGALRSKPARRVPSAAPAGPRRVAHESDADPIRSVAQCRDPAALAVSLTLARSRYPRALWLEYVDALVGLQERSDDASSIVAGGWTFTWSPGGFAAQPGWSTQTDWASFNAVSGRLRQGRLRRHFAADGRLEWHEFEASPDVEVPNADGTVPDAVEDISALLEHVEAVASLPAIPWIRDEYAPYIWSVEYHRVDG